MSKEKNKAKEDMTDSKIKKTPAGVKKKSGKKNSVPNKRVNLGDMAEGNGTIGENQTRDKGEMILSVVIPAYKEEKRIGNTLLSLDKYLSPLGFNYEIIVVIDGSPDNTFSVVEKYQKMIKNLSIINNPENHGKGYVVRQGLLAAKGAYRLFMDADNSVTINQMESFSPHFEDKSVGIVIGSRDIKGADVKKHQPFWKELLGNMGNFAIRLVTGLWGIPDTQCGFKILTAEATELVCPLMMVNRFGFDFEMLVLMKKLGFKIKEAPVVWINDEATTVTLFGPNGYIRVLWDLFRLRINLWTGKYDVKGALEKKNTLK